MSMVIPSRFNGPPSSGNGGVAAGLLAGRLPSGPIVQVTLRLPPPLDVEMRIEPDGPLVRLLDGDLLIAEAAVVAMDLEPVPPVDFETATDAATRFDGFVEHPFPTCFVCGTERPGQDGLALYPGAILPSDRTRVAAPFVPREATSEVLVWGVLDCPGGWSIGMVGRRAVLGRMTALVEALPVVGERCVVVGQCDGWDGRKAFSRSTAYGSDGRLLGTASATWIELP